MKALITGAGGLLAKDLMAELVARGHEAVGLSHDHLDVREEERVETEIKRHSPDVVFNCAAWTNDDAASIRQNVDLVWSVNVIGTRVVAQTCARFGIPMVHLSSDYVFDGAGRDPWEVSPPRKHFAPMNFYGWTKLESETVVRQALREHFIVRTSWLFGAHGNSFVKTMLDKGRSQPELRVVDDQVGRPTWSKDLARLLVDMAGSYAYGTYHATNEGEPVSWADFARAIFRRVGLSTRVISVTTKEYGGGPAQRPKNSWLSNDKLHRMGFSPLPDWEDALDRFLAEWMDTTADHS